MFKRRLSSRRRRGSKAVGSTVTGASSGVTLRSILRSVDQDQSVESVSWTDGQSSCTTGKSASSSPKQKRVLFGNVHVREYERTLGDNPSCSSGAPIAIGWTYKQELTHQVDDYETSRPNRRRQPQLVLTRQDREELLLEWGSTFHEIIDAIRSNVRVKNQRRRTVNSIGTYDRWEEVMENAGRRIKKTLLMQNKQPVNGLPKPTRRPSNENKHQGRQRAKKGETSSLDNVRPLPRHAMPEASPSIKKSASMNEIAGTLMNKKEPGASGGEPCDDNSVSSAQLPSDSSCGENPPAAKASSSIVSDCDVSSMASGSFFDELYDDDFRDLVSEEGDNDDASTIQTQTSEAHINGMTGAVILNSSQLFQAAENQFSFEFGAMADEDESSDAAFENLRRDSSFWEVDDKSFGPAIRRKVVPVIITEESPPRPHPTLEEAWLSGFSRQNPPPPNSDNIISRWE